ncbi:hypothetical protein ON010_g10531 [Phytophthora cinnamomi]|nr:hypothetical protein ON010_g10531 [Phytophthora cinnamomi]
MSPFGLSVQSAMGRPRTTGTGKKPKRYTRIAVDNTHKRRLLEFLAADYSVNEAIPHFYPNCSESDTQYKALEVAADEGLSLAIFKASHSWRYEDSRRTAKHPTASPGTVGSKIHNLPGHGECEDWFLRVTRGTRRRSVLSAVTVARATGTPNRPEL